MLWLKALHIIAMVAWFAGIFYLPRLFVYHADTHDAISLQRFKVMERRLYFGIMWPAMLLTLGFGVSLLVVVPDYLRMGWLHAKLSLVGLLVVYHLYCGRCLANFSRDKNEYSAKFYRFFNEIPTILLIGMVILAVVKPF